MRYDVVIAGAGLAGACAAFHLSNTHRVLVLEREAPGAGATGAAAGLVNPFLGRKAKPAWRHREALDALTDLLDSLPRSGVEADASALFHRTGVLRPAADLRQAEVFATSAAAHPETTWLSAEATHERWPEVVAPHGALWIGEGGHLDLGALARHLVLAAEARGAEVRLGDRLVGWEENDAGLDAITESGARLPARRLLLALGDGFGAFPALDGLPLHRVKGQTVRLARPPGLGALPAVSGGVYVVPQPDALVVGATFEHAFSSLDSDPALSAALRAKAARLLPTLAAGSIVEARAGVRVTVPGTRLPLLGPLPGAPAVWVFTGLGAKGLLTAPLLARDLATFFADPRTIPREVRTDQRT
jgi:glycine oxidase